MESIIQKDKECLACRMILNLSTTRNLHSHHCIYGTSNRKNSEKYGLKVWLCAYHHNMSDAGVHFDKELDMHIKVIAQKAFEAKWGDRTLFRRIFGKSYL